MIYFHSVILLQTVVVFAFPMQALIVAGWWDTQLTHKQLNKVGASKLTLDAYS